MSANITPHSKAVGQQNTPFYFANAIWKRVFAHCLGNIAGDPLTPLVQLWYSPPGEGKTFGLLGIYRTLGIRVIQFDASMFESFEAGGPGRMLRDGFEDAMRSVSGLNGTASPAVVILNDIDLAIGHIGGMIQHTSNREHFQVVLMDLTDRFAANGRRRIPRPGIVMTANRPDALHGPMIREGRAEVLPWKLNPADRLKIVGRICPHLQKSDIEKLISSFPEASIAFFASLSRHVDLKQRMLKLNPDTAKDHLQLALKGQWQFHMSTPSVSELIAAGVRLNEERQGLIPEVEVEE